METGTHVSRIMERPFQVYLRKWLGLAGIIGVVTGLSVVALDVIIRVIFLGNLTGEGGLTGLTTWAYSLSPLSSLILPFMGMVVTGLILWRFAREPGISGSDEVLEHYHFSNAPLESREGLVKYVASMFTIGLGGSAGLEGPSINSGAVVGSWLWKRARTRLGLSRDDLRIMLLAGAAAGISAIFKAPLTGIVFALEVPYKDDIARRAFLPAMISGVFSYVTFASFEGFQPLFSFSTPAAITPLTLGLSAVLGLLVAAVSVFFAQLYHTVRRLIRAKDVSTILRLSIGGIGIGLLALAVRIVSTSPYSYGPGYNLIQGSLLGQFSEQTLLALLALRLVTTALTLGTGGVGGIFFPLVLFGAITGSLFGLIVQGPVSLYASVGIAAFMSAGYKTPLAAVTFIGDTTASVSYLIPGMIASAIAYVVSGESSVSSEQKVWEGQTRAAPVES